MPRAPQLERSVAPTALPGVRRQSAETFASQGGTLAQAQERFGQVASQIAGGMYAEARRKAAEEAAALERLTIRRRFTELNRLLLQSPDRGLLHKQGRDPQDALNQYVDEWDTTADDLIASEIRTDGGRLFFEEEKLRHRDAFVARAATHASQQMRSYRAQELDALIKSSVDAGAAAVDPRDPRAAETVAFHMQAIEDAIDTNAELLGLGPEQQQAMKAAARSDLHVRAIQTLVAQGKDRDASDYFSEVQDQIAAGAKPALLERLKRSSTDSLAFHTANEIWDSMAAAAEGDDQAPIELDKLEAAARQRFRDDPEAYRATVAYLRDRKQGVDASRRQRQSARDAAIWSAVMQGATPTTLRSLPEFRLSPPEEQQKVLDYLQRQAEQAEALLAARESRAFARAQREERERDERGYQTYLELKANPARLRAMTQGEILRLLPDVGSANVNRILDAREQLLRGDDPLDGFRTNQQIAESALRAAGINTADTEAARKSGDRARADRFLAELDRRVMDLQRGSGKKVTNDEIQRLADALLIEVYVDGDPKRIFEVTPADLPDWARNRLSVAMIPATERRQIDDALRRHGRPVTDVERLNLYLAMVASRSGR